MTSGREGGYMVVRKQVVARKFVPGELSAFLEYIQATHAELKYFLETDFASYLHLGDLDMEGHCMLCNDLNVKGQRPEGSISRDGRSSPIPGM